MIYFAFFKGHKTLQLCIKETHTQTPNKRKFKGKHCLLGDNEKNDRTSELLFGFCKVLQLLRVIRKSAHRNLLRIKNPFIDWMCPQIAVDVCFALDLWSLENKKYIENNPTGLN